jgi:hypothetical protein
MRPRSLAAKLALIGSAAAAYTLRGRRWQLRWGATDQEVDEALPGDGLIASPNLTATRAITVRTSADRVWPWIAQLGQDRGGFYSYDFLENLVGCKIHSADRVVPEWQHPQVGDEVKLHPEVALGVAALEPGRSLVLRGGVPMGRTPPPTTSRGPSSSARGRTKPHAWWCASVTGTRVRGLRSLSSWSRSSASP